MNICEVHLTNVGKEMETLTTYTHWDRRQDVPTTKVRWRVCNDLHSNTELFQKAALKNINFFIAFAHEQLWKVITALSV